MARAGGPRDERALRALLRGADHHQHAGDCPSEEHGKTTRLMISLSLSIYIYIIHMVVYVLHIEQAYRDVYAYVVV